LVNTRLRRGRTAGQPLRAALIILGTVALLCAATATAAGGDTIATAPTLPLGKKITGGAACCSEGYNHRKEFWRVTLQRGDRLKVDFGTTNGDLAALCVLDPSVTDFTLAKAGCLAIGLTYHKDQFSFGAPVDGTYILEVLANTEEDLAYLMTASIRQRTEAFLTGPATAHARAPITLRGRVERARSGKVVISTYIAGAWVVLGSTPLRTDGSFRFPTRTVTRGMLRFRAIYTGDGSHAASTAFFAVRVH
jgi:hypothetical protein